LTPFLKDDESIRGTFDCLPPNKISVFVNGKRGITADTAARLARFFGTSPQYRLNIQNRYDLEVLTREAIEREVIPKRAA